MRALVLPLLAAIALAPAVPAAAPKKSGGACLTTTTRVFPLAARNDEWIPMDFTVQPGDVLLVMVEGEVKVGAWSGLVGPAGAPSSGYGRVELKDQDGEVTKVGEQLVGTVDEPTKIKLRIWDTDYSDNDGDFIVRVVVVPAALIGDLSLATGVRPAALKD